MKAQSCVAAFSAFPTLAAMPRFTGRYGTLCRAARLDEPRLTSMSALMERRDHALQPLMGVPFGFFGQLESVPAGATHGTALPQPVPIRTTALATQPSFGGTATNTQRSTHRNVDAHLERPKISGETNRAPLVPKLWKRRGIGPAGCANGEKVGGCVYLPVGDDTGEIGVRLKMRMR
jgi:hypothetical protein